MTVFYTVIILEIFMDKNKLKKNYDGLDKKYVTTGVKIAALGVLVWMLIIYFVVIHEIPTGSIAVITSKNKVIRIENSGLSYKIPIIERVHIVDILKTHVASIKNVEYLSKDKIYLPLNVEYYWKICKPKLFFKNRTKSSENSMMKRILNARFEAELRDKMAYFSDKKIINDSDSGAYRNLIKAINVSFNELGVCLNKDPKTLKMFKIMDV